MYCSWTPCTNGTYANVVDDVAALYESPSNATDNAAVPVNTCTYWYSRTKGYDYLIGVTATYYYAADIADIPTG